MIDQQMFRDAMARLAAAVSVVTSDGPGGRCGCTVSAVCSVSDVPPILLVCINRSSRNNAILKQNLRLCVNVLRADQQAIAMRFAQSGGTATDDTRFSDSDWSTYPGADSQARPLPALNEALVGLDCEITDSAEVGSHTVFYCTVTRARFGGAGSALTYFERAFHTLAATDAA